MLKVDCVWRAIARRPQAALRQATRNMRWEIMAPHFPRSEARSRMHRGLHFFGRGSSGMRSWGVGALGVGVCVR